MVKNYKNKEELKGYMKQNTKRLKAIGRKYAKQAFHLTEDDFVELSMLERAYLNGYKRCLKELQAGYDSLNTHH